MPLDLNKTTSTNDSSSKRSSSMLFLGPVLFGVGLISVFLYSKFNEASNNPKDEKSKDLELARKNIVGNHKHMLEDVILNIKKQVNSEKGKDTLALVRKLDGSDFNEEAREAAQNKYSKDKPGQEEVINDEEKIKRDCNKLELHMMTKTFTEKDNFSKIETRSDILQENLAKAGKLRIDQDQTVVNYRLMLPCYSATGCAVNTEEMRLLRGLCVYFPEFDQPNARFPEHNAAIKKLLLFVTNSAFGFYANDTNIADIIIESTFDLGKYNKHLDALLLWKDVLNGTLAECKEDKSENNNLIKTEEAKQLYKVFMQERNKNPQGQMSRKSVKTCMQAGKNILSAMTTSLSQKYQLDEYDAFRFTQIYSASKASIHIQTAMEEMHARYLNMTMSEVRNTLKDDSVLSFAVSLILGHAHTIVSLSLAGHFTNLVRCQMKSLEYGDWEREDPIFALSILIDKAAQQNTSITFEQYLKITQDNMKNFFEILSHDKSKTSKTTKYSEAKTELIEMLEKSGKITPFLTKKMRQVPDEVEDEEITVEQAIIDVSD